MNRALVQALPILAIVMVPACSGGAPNQSTVPANAVTAIASGEVPFLSMDPVRRLCPTASGHERMECFGMVRTDVVPTLQTAPYARKAGESCPFDRGYCPVDLQEAYDLPSLSAGKGKVVAIVDAYGYRHAASDLAYFRETMGLKACDAQTKCLRVVNQNGSPLFLPDEPPPSQGGWVGEESLDLDMVSGICPNCRIVLVQTTNAYASSLYIGVQTAERFARYIGLSWGGSEWASDNPIFYRPGSVISAAAGDDGGGSKFGGGPIQPCTYPFVVCVGGTHLARDSHNRRGWHETVWNDFNLECRGGRCGATGSACSRVVPKPSWQHDTSCRMRSAADTAAVASLGTPVIVYNSKLGCSPPKCFWFFGGTSVSAQIISAVYALAANAGTQKGAQEIWKHHDGNVYDVMSGNNVAPKLGMSCASPVKYICAAGAGFDGPTGWGTPAGLGTF